MNGLTNENHAKTINEAFGKYEKGELTALKFIEINVPIEWAVKQKQNPELYRKAGFLCKAQSICITEIKKSTKNKKLTLNFFKRKFKLSEILERYQRFTFSH